MDQICWNEIVALIMEVYYKLYLNIVLSSHNFVPCMLSFGDFKLWECCSRNDSSATAAVFKNINYRTDPLKLFTVMQTTMSQEYRNACCRSQAFKQTIPDKILLFTGMF